MRDKNSINIVLSLYNYFLGVANLPLQIIDLRRDTRVLRANQQSQLANKFRELAENLTEQLEKLTQNIRGIINTHGQQLHQPPNGQGDRQINNFNPVTIILLSYFLLFIWLIIEEIFQIVFTGFFKLTNHFSVF